MRRFLALVFLLIAGPAFGQSHPVFFQRASDIARFTAMKSNYDANPSAPSALTGQLYKYIKTQADSGARYYDFGQFAGYMYMFTCAAGACDSTYVTKAWTQLTATVDAHQGGGFLNRPTSCTSNPGISGNYSRYFGWQYWLLYDQIYAGLSGANRTTFLNQLNAMAACVTASGGPAGWNFQPLDTDQTTGDYFMMAMAEVSTGSYNTTLDGYWNAATRKIGGYAATASDNTTRRNAIKVYITDFAADGEWMESSQYNLNTIKGAVIPAEAIRSVQTPTDNYPEITTWQQAGAEQMMYMIAPDINTASKPYQWGDVQTSDLRDLTKGYRFELCMTFAGLTGGTTIGPKIQDYCMDWLASAGDGSAGLTSIDPYPQGFLLFDGAATRGDHSTLPLSKYVSGQGLYSGFGGWTSADTGFWTMFSRHQSFDRANGQDQIDHAVTMFGEFQMIKGGAYAITHPLSYGFATQDSRGTNNLSLGGVAAWLYGVSQYRQVQAHEDDTTNGFLYITGTQGGSIVRSPYYGMPTNFIMEQTRSVVWLRNFDTVIVHDRANAKAPVTTGYNASLKTWMDSRPRKELYIHSPVSPTQGSGYLDWAYSGSNHTRVSLLLPPSPGIAIEDESVVWNAAYFQLGTIYAPEKKFHTIITPNDQSTQFHTFLNVWDAYATGTPATVALVQDTSNKVDCAFVTKSTTNRLLCFNALQGQDIPERTLTGGSGYYTAGVSTILDAVRKRTTSFTVVFTPAGGSTTKVFLYDLDDSKTWTYTLNGGGGGTLSVDSQGVGVISTSLTGAVTLAVATSGISSLLIETSSPLTNGDQNIAYSTCIVASGGLQPYTWSKTAGTYPTGLGPINASTGCITGTPSGTGLSNFTIQVADSQGAPATYSKPFDLTINAAASPVTITSPTSMPQGTASLVYPTQTIVTTGGTGPYVCTVSTGTLPTGLALGSCAVTGTPTVADEFSVFTIQSCDSLASCDTQDYQVYISFLNTNATNLTLSGIGSTMMAGYFGAQGIDFETDCSVTLLFPNGSTSTKTRTSGPARRGFYFSGLTAGTAYHLTASCVDIGFPANLGFTTLDAFVGTGPLVLSFKAPSLQNGTVNKIKVDYGLATGSVTDNTTTVSCAATCTVTLTNLVRGSVYFIQHTWLDASSVALTPTSFARNVVVQ